MKIGYARVSTQDQNLDWQLDALKAEGCERVYTEKVSGKKAERVELNRMLDTLREGDIVIVCELTRLGRSTKDLLSLIERIRNSKADLRSLKEGWLDTTTPQGRFMYTITAGLCEFERELTIQRTKDGLAAARARGRQGGRPKKDANAIKEAMALYDSKQFSVAEIAKKTGVSRTTLYEYKRKKK